MKLNKSLLSVTLSLLAATTLLAKEKPKKEEIPGVAAQPASFFYTGKPYDADLGAYTFNFRNYDPSTARWTSADPSGFPDNANNWLYVSNNPACIFDDLGLTGKKIAWVMVNTTYGTQSADQVAYALQINLNMVINDMKSQDQNGNTNYLSDGDILGAALIRSNDLSGAVNAFSNYDRIVLYDHGFHDADTFTIYDGTTTHKTPGTVFGDNASKVYYATCYDAYSPNPTVNRTDISSAAQLIPAMKTVTKTYLYE